MKQLVPIVEFIQGIPPNIKRDDFFDARHPTLFVIDDLMKDATQSADVCELFTEGSHHRNLSVICLLQNLFCKGKEARTMSLNAHYMVLFKNPRDQQQVSVLARQMYPGRSQYFMEEYQAATHNPYGYLFVDLKQNTPEDMRLRSNIFLDSATNSQVSRDPKSDDPPTETYIKPSFETQAYLPYNLKQVNISESDPNNISQNTLLMDVSKSEPTPLPVMTSLKENHSSCIDCGAVYASSMDLKRHVKRGCPEADSDAEEDKPPAKKSAMDLDDDYNDPAFEDLINEAYDTYDEQYNDRIEKYMQDGMSEKRAKQEASDLLRPKYRKAFVKNYMSFLYTMYLMKHSPIHYKVWKSMEDYIEEGKPVKRAIQMAVEDYKHLMEELLDEESENSESDEDSGEDNHADENNMD